MPIPDSSVFTIPLLGFKIQTHSSALATVGTIDGMKKITR